VNLSEKVQNVNDLSRHLIDVRVAVEQGVMDDDNDQWCRCLHTCIRATGHFQ